MAQFTKVNGTTQPVFAIDVGNGSIAGTANVAANGSVQMAGPKLDFFTVTANTNLATSTGAGNATGYITNVLQAIQQTTTVAMYQVEPVTPWQSIAMAVYPSGAANTTTIVTAAQQANSTGGLNIGIPTANVSATAKFYN